MPIRHCRTDAPLSAALAHNTCTNNYYGGLDGAARFPLETSQNLFHTIIGNVCINNREAGIGFDGKFVNALGNMNYLNQWEGIYADASGPSGFTTPPLTLGNHRLWVDSGSRLRIKNGVPTADTDGTVVGEQT